MVKISFIMITARTDHPYIGRPDLGIFQPTLESLKAQTFKDFELVIIDQLYDDRKDYFKDKDLPFKVKHLDAKPNVWHEVGMAGVSTQFNKGIIHADGELLFFSGEGYLYIPEFCERLWKHYQQGYIPLAWYIYDNTFVPQNMKAERSEDWKIVFPEDGTNKYNICGYTGENIVVEHRTLTAFKGNDLDIHESPWDWYYGCSSAPLTAMLKINGFDQKFDGDYLLLDCDVGSRLHLAGYFKLALFRDLFIIRARPNSEWNPKLVKGGATIKCNYPLIHWSRVFNRPRANEHAFTDEDIQWIKEDFCAKRCGIREACRTEHPWQFPFEHKEGYGYKCNKKLFDYWRTHQGLIDLTEERKK